MSYLFDFVIYLFFFFLTRQFSLYKISVKNTECYTTKGGKKNETDDLWVDLKSGRFATLVKEAAVNRNISVNSAQAAYNIMTPLMAEKDDVEQLWAIFLNAKNRIIAIEKLSTGTLTAASVYPREVVKAAITKKAAALVVAHNRPSNDPTPPPDQEITIRLAVALKTT